MQDKRIKQKGFTLVELLIVVSLIAITTGISGDVILTLVRSYNKTRITNELEQVGTFSMAKIEKELQKGTSVSAPGLNSCGPTLTFTNEDALGATQTISYNIPQAGATIYNLNRTLNGGTVVPVIDKALVNVRVTNALTAFCLVQASPAVVRVKLNLEQNSAGGAGTSFSGNVVLEQTIVLRGTY